MAFIPVVGCGCGAPRASSCPSVRGTRRAFLRLAVSAAAATLLSHSAHATDKPFVGKSRREWQPEELCGSCSGSGKQTCSMCEGSGTLAIDDSVVQQEHECPNCMGKGDVRCPACIGLGLADTKGILRDGTYACR